MPSSKQELKDLIVKGRTDLIASINLDRASQLMKDAIKKIEEENDVEGSLGF